MVNSISVVDPIAATDCVFGAALPAYMLSRCRKQKTAQASA